MVHIPLTWDISTEQKPKVAFLVPVKFPPQPSPSSVSSNADLTTSTPQKQTTITSSTSPSTSSSKIFSSPSSTSTHSPISSAASAVDTPSRRPSATPPRLTLIDAAASPHSHTPSFTTTSSPKSIRKSFPKSLALGGSGLGLEKSSLFTLFDVFIQGSSVLSSLYPTQPSPLDVISSILPWKDSPTVAGLIIRAAEGNLAIGLTERLQMLYLLAFTTPEFAMKVACVLSKLEGDKDEITHWLRTFAGAVEYKLGTGSSEEDILTVDERISLDAHFKGNIQESQEYRTEFRPYL
jgi:hypothetical protein